MRRFTFWPGLVALLLLAACGDDPEQAAPEVTEEAAAEQPGTDEPTAEEPTAAATTAAGEDGCTELEGATVTFVVPYTPGGGYDTYARMITPFLEEQLGATVVVENQPGAGGLLAINNLLTVPPDGTTIAIMNGVGAGGAEIADAEGVQFDLGELSYVGRVASEPTVVVSATSGPHDTFEQVLEAEDLQIGSTGPGAQDFVTAHVMNALFEDLDARIVSGFAGSSEVALALLQGEVDLMSGSLDSRLGGIEGGDEQPLLLMARERAEERIPDTPTLVELDLDQRQQELVPPYLSLLELGRPVVAPPGVPEDTLTCLRTALADALSDPELLEQAEQQQRPIAFLSGEEMDELVDTVTSAPEEFREIIAEAY